MTKTKLLSTAAALILLGTAAAAAQDVKSEAAPARAPAAQQKAPAEKIAPAMHAGQNVEPHADMKQPSDANGSADVKAKSATTGQGAASGSAKLSAEQRGKIAAIVRQQKVEPAHLTVAVRVGTRIPERVHFYPLPPEVFVIYPEWRGYDYVMVGNQILVVDPDTHEIVAILDA